MEPLKESGKFAEYTQSLPIEGLDDYSLKIVDKIREKLPEDVTLLYVAILGSRAKQMGSPGSDYDTKVIVMNPKRKYLLQKVTAARHFETEIDGIELEGTVVDILTAYKYALETNPMIYETFAGIPIYTTKAA